MNGGVGSEEVNDCIVLFIFKQKLIYHNKKMNATEIESIKILTSCAKVYRLHFDKRNDKRLFSFMIRTLCKDTQGTM